MLRFYETADTLLAEQDQFEHDIKDFVAGHIDPVKFKAIRVAHGVYEQRQNDTYMIRIRCAAGGITPTQLKKVAELGQTFGLDEVHFTTRQEVQLHNVLIQDVMNVIRGLNEVGLSSRGGGGNTIRNILTAPVSGIDPEGLFDVDPYAMALTSAMVKEADSWNLPRKFKIAMSHNGKDLAITQATCLGFVAAIRDGQKGFRVYCAGGMGSKPMLGHLLLDFIPDTRVYHVTRAIKTMFDKHGNRRSKYANRIKFLWKKLGDDDFKRHFHEAYDKIKDDESLVLSLPELKNEAIDPNIPIETPEGPDYALWQKRFVRPQVQEGLVSVKVPLQLGDLLREDADRLCDFLGQFGENNIRCDRDQNMRLRNIPEQYIGNLYNVIVGMKKTLVEHAPFIGNMINCTGASTCKLGICLPRGLSDAIRDKIAYSKLDLDQLDDFRLNMSGCPNTCGMHHIAHLGFFGKVGRNADRDMYPAYNVLAGARIAEGQTRYAERIDEISAKFVPDFVHDFFEVYIAKKADYADYYAFLDAEGRTLIKSLCDKYREAPSFAERPDFFKDWGAKRQLSLDELGTAECSAGMFDMIDVDKKYITSLRKNWDALENKEDEAAAELLYKILFHASRMLLVTRGLDAKTEAQVFELFGKHFVQTELVAPDNLDVVTLGKLNVKSELVKHTDRVLALGEEVIALYKGMDDSLRFGMEKKEEPAAEVKADGGPDLEKDYRGVACPMNFVKTKLELEKLSSGQTMKILLDDGEPIENVPNSVKLEGHQILAQDRVENYWSVLIKKG